ncbi:MAG: BACON domain-containing carbohydrate-binding protein [Bryobacteraceae bacterium]
MGIRSRMRWCRLIAVVPLYLIVLALPELGLAQYSVPFEYQIGGTLPSPVVYSVFSSAPVGVTLLTDGATWLSASLSSNTTPAYLTLSVNPTGLAVGTYTSIVTVSSGIDSLTWTVSLTVSGGTPAISVSSSLLSYTYQSGGNLPQALTVTVTASSAVAFTASASGGGWLSVSPASGTTPASLSVSVNPTGLSPGSYNGTITITAPGASNSPQTVSVSLTVTSSTSAPTISLNPNVLNYTYQSGGNLPQALAVTVTASSAVAFTAAASGGGWLSVSPASGTTPASLSVSVNPTGLSPGSYNGTITITAPGASNSPQTVSVSLVVSSIGSIGTATMSVNPSVLNYAYQSGGNLLPPQAVTVAATSAVAFTASAAGSSWLSVSPASGTTPFSLSVSVNPTALSPGVYSGTITITALGASNSPQTVSVSLVVSSIGAATINVNPSVLNYAYQSGGNLPPPQAVTVAASWAAAFTAAASGGTWLSVGPASGTTPASLSVSVDPTALSPGVYNGTITITVPGTSPLSVAVTLTVTTISVNPSVLNYAYQSGGDLPPPQAVTVAASWAAAFTAAASGGTWLSVGPASGTTPANLSVSVNPTGLSPGSYNGTITITAPGASPLSVAVTLTVTSPSTISVSPRILNYAYQSGGDLPEPQAVTVSATSVVAFTASAAGSSWLSVSPAIGTTPASLSVSVNPAGLNPGTYEFKITVTGTNGTQSAATVDVSLTVTMPQPTIMSVLNAASYATGAVSPGELVTIFGTAIGPATPVGAATDPSSGKLATTIGGVQVLFNGIPAPMIYAASERVSAVVPYEMASVASPLVWIEYAGQTSNAFALTSTTTAPALFTQTWSGSGPGAILKQDNSLNGPGNAAAKGSIVQVYMTGEGQTNPPGVTGAITRATLPPPQVTPAPMLPIEVTIAGLPALYAYAGEAPGLVAGIMQLNVQIPATAPSGDLQILVSIGGNTSQNGVTVSVR